MNDGVVWLTIFVLSVFVGIEVISKVSSTLHTPLMSGANAIHGVILLGAIIATAETDNGVAVSVGLVAIEAMACGAPGLTSSFASMPELVEAGVNGVLAESMEQPAAAGPREVDPDRE